MDLAFYSDTGHGHCWSQQQVLSWGVTGRKMQGLRQCQRTNGPVDDEGKNFAGKDKLALGDSTACRQG